MYIWERPIRSRLCPSEQTNTESEAKEITITTFEQAQEYFPKLLAPKFEEGELKSVKYTPLTGKLIFDKNQISYTFLELADSRIAHKGDTIKQLKITYTLTDGLEIRVSVQKNIRELNFSDEPDMDIINLNKRLYIRLYQDHADFIEKDGYSYRIYVSSPYTKQTLYEQILRYEKPEPNFYDEHPDWFSLGRDGVSTRNPYYFAGNMSNVETNGGYTLQIPEAIQDKIYIFSDVNGGVRIYLKARYGMEPIIHEKFGYAWPAPQHFAPFFSLYVTEEEYPRLKSSYEHHLATDGQHYYTFSTAYDYSEHDAEMTPEQFFAPIEALGITADTFFDMMAFDNPDDVVRAEE